MADLTNDNEVLPTVCRVEGPDAHGQAAMLLVESLIHALIARSVIRLEDAIDVVTVAIDVRIEMSAEPSDTEATFQKSIELLSAIRQSLSLDNR